ncbi:hypothetical protein [Ammoniphilus sp. CFH 90114]|uniref:hypothetical protein n=1 Tax=Ammoniphilus sp. CFH 90114 TaxID=2493665 RepID=UPI00100E6EE4|nr:hypothetical protein [Ammoniphilus sp. CFH 90114]RXT14959.1 hypothetical protein EIZ39_01755 [Ammoniphilus sp. CFH 90114]
MKHNIYYTYEIEHGDRHLFRWNETMRDAGMAEDNVMLDFNVDNLHEAIYLGLIRIPHLYRAHGIGEEIVNLLKLYAKDHHYSILLESAPENMQFWQKMHFSTFLYEDYGFWMMGYGAKNKQLFKVKWNQMKPLLCNDAC